MWDFLNSRVWEPEAKLSHPQLTSPFSWLENTKFGEFSCYKPPFIRETPLWHKCYVNERIFSPCSYDLTIFIKVYRSNPWHVPTRARAKKNHRTMRLLSGLWILRQDRGKANHSGKLLLHSPRVPRQLVGFQDVDDGWYPWITLWLCQNSYWTWDFYGIFMGFLWDLPSGND